MEWFVSRGWFTHKPGTCANEKERDQTFPHPSVLCSSLVALGITPPSEVGIQTQNLQVNKEYSTF